MALQDSLDRFGWVTKRLHWTVAILFLGQYLWIGLKKYILPKKSAWGLFLLVSLHKPVGVCIIFFGAFFIVWRLLNRHPVAVPMVSWELLVIRCVQGCLFLGMLLVPLTGWVMSSAGGYPVHLFGFSLPLLVAKNKVMATQWHTYHTWVAYGLAGLIGLHICGGLKHHFYDKDDTLKRMLPRSWLGIFIVLLIVASFSISLLFIVPVFLIGCYCLLLNIAKIVINVCQKKYVLLQFVVIASCSMLFMWVFLMITGILLGAAGGA
jgi:cytochrome b561